MYDDVVQLDSLWWLNNIQREVEVDHGDEQDVPLCLMRYSRGLWLLDPSPGSWLLISRMESGGRRGTC